MKKPKLWIVAGCNGSGKSSYSKALVDKLVVPYDYDANFLRIYHSLQSMDIQERMALEKASCEMRNEFGNALTTLSDFCYETNFNSAPMHWPDLFRAKGFRLHLIYFVLDSIEEAKKRVAIRVQNGGHFVPDYEIQSRYNQGFANLDRYFDQFDSLDVYDCSFYKQTPKFCYSLIKGKLILSDHFPVFLKELIPNISQIFQTN